MNETDLKTRFWIYFDKGANKTPLHSDQILRMTIAEIHLLKAAGVLYFLKADSQSHFFPSEK